MGRLVLWPGLGGRGVQDVSDEVKHLARDRCHDEWTTWCDAYQTGAVQEPEDATCATCLDQAAQYGERARRALVGPERS